jgi:ceramide glucosyltransferase
MESATPEVGVLTSLVRGERASGMGGVLEEVHLSTFYPRAMALSFWVGRPCVLGKSMAFRKSEAARFGGLEKLGVYLAEDFMTGEIMRRLGLKVALATGAVAQPIGKLSLKSFWNRHLRWCRIRKAHASHFLVFEPLSWSWVSSGIGALWLSHHFEASLSGAFLSLGPIWWIADGILYRKMGGKRRAWVLHWVLREAYFLPLWVFTLMGSAVEWRGEKYRVLSGGTMLKI